MTLEELFQDLMRQTGTTPRTIRKQGREPITRVILPTHVWDRFQMLCYLEYSAIDDGAEELIVQLYKASNPRKPEITLWLANLYEEAAYAGQEPRKTIVECHVGKDQEIQQRCVSLLRSKRTQYEEILKMLEKRSCTEVEYRNQFDERTIRDLVYRVCDPAMCH